MVNLSRLGIAMDAMCCISTVKNRMKPDARMPGKIMPLNVETVITYTFQNIRGKNVAVNLAMMITGIYS
jgi:hypothetical protein